MRVTSLRVSNGLKRLDPGISWTRAKEHLPHLVERVCGIDWTVGRGMEDKLLSRDKLFGLLEVLNRAAVIMAPIQKPRLHQEGAANVEERLGICDSIGGRAGFLQHGPAGCVDGKAPDRWAW